MATLLPFHRRVVRDEAFAPAWPDEPFTVHNRWIETEFHNDLPPFSAAAGPPDQQPRETVVVEVGGRRLEVTLPAGLGSSASAAAPASSAGAAKPAKPKRTGAKPSGAAASGDTLTSPMQGTIVKIAVDEGSTVAVGDLVVVLEAMKMEQPINAHKAGTVTGMSAAVGEVVTAGTALCEIKD